MILRELLAANFRNYSELRIVPSEGINILCGDNAAGKTNILEAIYTVCTAKSPKSAHDREMIAFGEEEAHLKAIVDKKGIGYRIDMHLKKSRPKGIAVNGAAIRKISELIGICEAVSFSPEDLSIIKMGPAERRRFLDQALCQLDKVYIYNLISYNKVINQKNKLLKNFPCGTGSDEILDIYDEQLAEYGSELINIRTKFISEINGVIKDIHKGISDGTEEIELFYEANVGAVDFAGKLTNMREAEKKNMVSLAGPHKDDLKFLSNGRDLRYFGSQGQQRSAVISLKLSEIEIVKAHTGDTPILLLDDVLSELDRNRQCMLLENIGNIQTFITCTGLDDFVDNGFSMDRIFDIGDGQAHMRNSTKGMAG